MSGPRCSVIVPVHDNVGLTQQCLESFLASLPATRFELVVVDDGSTDSTGAMLEGYGQAIRRVRLGTNSGFAAACNAGAESAHASDFLVFLNNDTLTRSPWLDELVAHAVDRDAGIVGAKLLFPNETVQHAGIVICRDGLPRNLYAGLPGDHPAVSRSRDLQAVTGACMLVSRSMFDAVGGFDCAFRNSLEDVDLCLRAGKLGAAVRYCAEASLYHLESASRGRSSPGADPALRLFRTRWSGRVRPDDLDVYLEDGLIEIAYEATHPARLRVSPELAILDGEVGGLLFERSRQCAQLLLEITRLTARLAEERFERSHERRAPTWRAGPAAGADLDLALSRLDGIEAELHDLQVALGRLATGDPAFPSEQLGYRRTVRDVRDAVARAVPEDAAVAVVSRGDDALLDLGLRTGWHFPAASDGTYLGYHPASGEEALAWLHDARARGADYIVVPDTSRWWLTRYASFGAFLAGCERIGDESAPCSIYRLPAVSGPGPSPTRKDELVNGR